MDDEWAKWERRNLVAWMVAPPWDARGRDSLARAEMLSRLGFGRYTHFVGGEAEIRALPDELRALSDHGIELEACRHVLEPEDPRLVDLLETAARCGVAPRMWIMHSVASGWTDAELASVAQTERISREAARIERYARVCEPYGVEVCLYNHNGWFGRLENQLAIIEHLLAREVASVRIAYNFSHARDEDHDDSVGFAELWSRISRHVTNVNVTGMRWEKVFADPGDGDADVDMLGVIQASGWDGRFGLIAERAMFDDPPGDVEPVLLGALRGWESVRATLRG